MENITQFKKTMLEKAIAEANRNIMTVDTLVTQIKDIASKNCYLTTRREVFDLIGKYIMTRETFLELVRCIGDFNQDLAFDVEMEFLPHEATKALK